MSRTRPRAPSGTPPGRWRSTACITATGRCAARISAISSSTARWCSSPARSPIRRPTTTAPGSPPPGPRTVSASPRSSTTSTRPTSIPAAARRGPTWPAGTTRSRPPPPRTAGAASRGKTPPAVVAAAPFRQEVDQGRHRGFFNPSNIVADGRWRYFLASTTGWTRPGSDQEAGVCLFRSDDPADPTRWRAWTGTGFTAAFPDPYLATRASPATCRPVGPFPGPVGAVVRHRGSGAWIAVFMAKAGERLRRIRLLLDVLPRPDHLGHAAPAGRRRHALRRSLHAPGARSSPTRRSSIRTRRGATSTMSATRRS